MPRRLGRLRRSERREGGEGRGTCGGRRGDGSGRREGRGCLSFCALVAGLALSLSPYF